MGQSSYAPPVLLTKVGKAFNAVCCACAGGSDLLRPKLAPGS